MLTMGHAFGNLYTSGGDAVIMNRYDKIDSQMLGKIERTSRMYEEYNRDPRGGGGRAVREMDPYQARLSWA
jgi:hypothetical protein